MSPVVLTVYTRILSKFSELLNSHFKKRFSTIAYQAIGIYVLFICNKAKFSLVLNAYYKMCKLRMNLATLMLETEHVICLQYEFKLNCCT